MAPEVVAVVFVVLETALTAPTAMVPAVWSVEGLAVMRREGFLMRGCGDESF